MNTLTIRVILETFVAFAIQKSELKVLPWACEALTRIKGIYSDLSKDFIHFSTEVLPDSSQSEISDSSIGKNILWDLEGIGRFLEITRPIMNYYFEELMKQKRPKRLKISITKATSRKTNKVNT
jgi:hypothetical protein